MAVMALTTSFRELGEEFSMGVVKARRWWKSSP